MIDRKSHFVADNFSLLLSLFLDFMVILLHDLWLFFFDLEVVQLELDLIPSQLVLNSFVPLPRFVIFFLVEELVSLLLPDDHFMIEQSLVPELDLLPQVDVGFYFDEVLE